MVDLIISIHLASISIPDHFDLQNCWQRYDWANKRNWRYSTSIL